MQLLEDICTYQRDMQSAVLQHKEEKKQKEMNDKSIGEEMRKADMENLAHNFLLLHRFPIIKKLLFKFNGSWHIAE